MHSGSLFTELSIIIAICALIALVMRFIRQPLIISYILTGLIVGPVFLNIIPDENSLEVFAKIGIALLLFIIGLGLNPRVIKEVGKVTLAAGTLSVGLITFVGFIAGQSFGFTNTESVVIGLGLAFSSTIIILKLLSDLKETNRLHGKIVIGILLVEDIFATLALILLTARTENAFSLEALILLLVKGLAIGIPLFIVAAFVLPKIKKLISGSQEFLFLFTIGWGFGIAALFEYAGFSIEIGALIAGVALASLPYAQEAASRLRPVRDFFLVVFFIVLGTRISFENIGEIILPVMVFSFIAFAIKPLLLMIIMGVFGYTKKTSFKVSGALAQISEFSLVLVILGASQGVVRPEIVSIMTLVALITIASSSYAITYSNQIYTLLERKLSLFERRKTHNEETKRKTYDMILFGYNKGGQEFVRVMQQLGKKYVVVDYDPDVIDILDRKSIPYLYGDVTDIELLEELNTESAKLIVSTLSDHSTNLFLVRWLEKINPHAVFVCTADTANQAEALYEEGAAYVMLPHYIGSEKIGSFIKKNGFNKTEFRHFREKHLQHIQATYVV
jgi:Kef-type K+ transport system membrane component KefB